MTPCKELTGEKREKFKKWLKQFQKENDRSPTIEEVYDEATETTVVEHFEAYGQCRDSRRIADLENELANVSYQLEGREIELKELQEENERLAKHILELQADKGRLTDELTEKDKQIEELKIKIQELQAEKTDFLENWYCDHKGGCLAEELEAQIEKMKCCENCKHHHFMGDELKCGLDYDTEFECLKTKQSWELAE